MTATQKNIIGRIAKLKSEIKELWTDCAILRAENERLRQERDDLKRFVYEDAPRIAAKETNDQTAALREEINHLQQGFWSWFLWSWRCAPLREEVERLRQELSYIANAKDYVDAKEFRTWAQSRARHALNQEAGTLTIKRGK